MKHRVFLGLGANLGDPVQQLREAVGLLAALPDVEIEDQSSLWLTAPVGFDDQPDFVKRSGQYANQP